jgi:3-hydroxyisobutyrate dehydrogenase-like beta-hydroxyacid dehydrogenase
MGHAIGAVLGQHGLRVLTNLQGPSARTEALAAQAGMIDVGDDQTLVREADILLSVLVPTQAYSFAERVAVAVRATQASGLKMCYASVTKGLTALASEALTAGQALGLADVLTNELQDSQRALFQWFERQIPRMPPKAYRWAGEMEEIACTFADLGLPPQLLEGAAALYRLVGQTELGAETPEERHLGQTLEEVTGILAAMLKTEADQA